MRPFIWISGTLPPQLCGAQHLGIDHIDGSTGSVSDDLIENV
jgi:hypothetical protein